MKRAMVLFLVGLVAFVLLVLIDGAVFPRDTVSFTLTFADRPIPDMKGYEALWLTGKGFKYDNDLICGETYCWFTNPVRTVGLPWNLTYDGYADIFCHGSDKLPDTSGLTAEALTNKTLALCRADDEFWRRLKAEGRDRGDPRFWAVGHLIKFYLTKDMDERSLDLIVRNGLFYDLTARFGTTEAKKRIISVSSDYDWGTRFCLGYRIPTLTFEKVKTGFRQVYADGIGGEKIAELYVKYPGKFLGGGFYWDKAEDYFKPAVLDFVLKELQKPENRGKTIKGSYTRKKVKNVQQNGPVIYEMASSWEEALQIEGQ